MLLRDLYAERRWFNWRRLNNPAAQVNPLINLICSSPCLKGGFPCKIRKRQSPKQNFSVKDGRGKACGSEAPEPELNRFQNLYLLMILRGGYGAVSFKDNESHLS